MKKVFWFCLTVTILEFIAALYLYPSLPQTIPTHWNVFGEIDGYGSRFTIFIAPFISLIMTFFLPFIPKIDPKGENIKKSGIAFPATIISINLFFAFVFALIIHSTITSNSGFTNSITLPFGIMFIIIGYFMPNIKPNYLFGIRTPWTLHNEDVWIRTHKLGGRVFMGAGVVCLISTLLPAPANFAVLMTTIITASLWVTVYSYVVYNIIRKQ